MEKANCSVCGADHSDLLFSQYDLMFGKNEGIRFNVVKCRDCGMLFTNPRPTQDEIGEFYRPEYHYLHPGRIEDVSWRRKVKERLKAGLLAKYYGYAHLKGAKGIPLYQDLVVLPLTNILMSALRKKIDLFPFKPGGKLLDVGCGSGSNLLYWKHFGWDVHGVELAPTVARYAREQLNLPVKEGTLEQAQYPAKSFDVVMFNNVLEHLHDPLRTLRETHRILKDDGKLLISVPNLNCADRWLFNEWWSPWDLPRHLSHFTRKTLALLLENAGMEIETMRSDNVPMNSLLNFSFYIKHVFHRRIFPWILYPVATVWSYVGGGNLLYVRATKRMERSRYDGMSDLCKCK